MLALLCERCLPRRSLERDGICETVIYFVQTLDCSCVYRGGTLRNLTSPVQYLGRQPRATSHQRVVAFPPDSIIDVSLTHHEYESSLSAHDNPAPLTRKVRS